ncbi:uncharacterized protein METZ01_LOCUS455143, partial [marine metagenome]
VAKAWQANYFRLQYSTKGKIDNPYPKVKHLIRKKASRLCGNKEMKKAVKLMRDLEKE